MTYFTVLYISLPLSSIAARNGAILPPLVAPLESRQNSRTLMVKFPSISENVSSSFSPLLFLVVFMCACDSDEEMPQEENLSGAM